MATKKKPTEPKVGYEHFKSISPRGRILLGVLGMTFSCIGLWLTDSQKLAHEQSEQRRRHVQSQR